MYRVNMTPRSRVKGMLRKIFLSSRERAEALKRDKYCCVKCGVKQSKKKGFEQKVQVHHKKGIDVWDNIIDLIYDQVLCDPEDLETVCPDCHDKITYDRQGEKDNGIDDVPMAK